MKKKLQSKFAVPLLAGGLVVTILIGVALGSWLGPASENIYQKMKIFFKV